MAVFILLLPNTRALAVECPEQIRIAFTDSSLPPYILGTGSNFEQPPGKFVTWSRNALETLGCSNKSELMRLPYKRILDYMEKGDVDFRVTGGFKKELLNIMVFPMKGENHNRELAVAENRTMLYALSENDDISWDGQTLLDGDKPGLVGTVRGHFAERLSNSKALAVDSAPHWEANVIKLMNNRITAIVGPESVIEAFAEAKSMQALEPPLAVNTYYAPVSKVFYEKYPDFTRQFWLALCKESREFFDKLPACKLE